MMSENTKVLRFPMHRDEERIIRTASDDSCGGGLRTRLLGASSRSASPSVRPKGRSVCTPHGLLRSLCAENDSRSFGTTLVE